MIIAEKPGFILQRGTRLLVVNGDGKLLERLVVDTAIPPIPGLWCATDFGDRIFLMDGGSDGSVFLTTGVRLCVLDVGSGRQRILFRDAVVRDRLGRPVTEVEGAEGNGLSDWQLFGLRMLPSERVLHITLRHPIHGTSVCGVDARTGAAVVTQGGTWRRMTTAQFIDERAGVNASVERDASDVPVIVTVGDSGSRLVIGVPAGTIGKFSEVSVSPDGKYVAVLLAGTALYLIDVARRISRKIGVGSYVSPQWSATGKVILLVKQNSGGAHPNLVEIVVNTLRERVVAENVHAFKLINRRRPDWIVKPTP